MAEETKEKRTAEKRRTDGNIIYVGNKPPMSYVLAVALALKSGFFLVETTSSY